MPSFPLGVNQIIIHDFYGSATNIIHSTNPRHLIVRFELFGHALTLLSLIHISSKKVEKYKNHLNSNPKYAEKEPGRVIIEVIPKS